MRAGVQVRGNATDEELAAVVALMAQLERRVEPDRYAEWRRTRLAAVRARLESTTRVE
jgi:hypothetical protein